MSRTDPQLKFRVSQELRDRLEEAAKTNKRSLTAEITARLESTFDRYTTQDHLPERLGTEEDLKEAFVEAFTHMPSEAQDAIVNLMGIMSAAKARRKGAS